MPRELRDAVGSSHAAHGALQHGYWLLLVSSVLSRYVTGTRSGLY